MTKTPVITWIYHDSVRKYKKLFAVIPLKEGYKLIPGKNFTENNNKQS